MERQVKQNRKYILNLIRRCEINIFQKGWIELARSEKFLSCFKRLKTLNIFLLTSADTMLVFTLIFFCLSNSKFFLELNSKEDPDVVKGM